MAQQPGPTPKAAAPPPPRATHSSYHPRGYGVSEGLKRARRPFAIKNAVTGTCIMAFGVGVYYYSISQVKQDDFGVSPEKARAPGAGAGGAASAGGSSVAVPGTPAAAAAQSNVSSTPGISADDERRAQILRAQGRLV